MPQFPTFYRLNWLRAGRLLLVAGMVAARGALGQTASVGYTSLLGGIAPASAYPFVTGNNTAVADTVVVVPFAFNSLGNYTLSSTALILSDHYYPGGELPVGSGDPGGGDHGGDPPGGGPGGSSLGTDVSLNVSIQILSALPGSLTFPPSLATFSISSQGPGFNPTLYGFGATSAPTFTAGSTYYLAIGVSGNLDWDMTTGDSNLGSYPGDNPVTNLVDSGTPLVYYKVTASGVESLYGNVGGFSLTASAVTAIPEPSSAGILLAGSILAAALVMRRRFASASGAP